MSTEWIRQVAVRQDGVYLDSKSNNDDRPFQVWKVESLDTHIRRSCPLSPATRRREIVRMLCEYAEIRGSHPSAERYRPCLQARGHFSPAYTDKVNAEYAKLTPEDIATQWLPDKEKTPAMLAYKQFSESERDKYYTNLAGCAAPLPASRNKSDRDRDSAR